MQKLLVPLIVDDWVGLSTLFNCHSIAASDARNGFYYRSKHIPFVSDTLLISKHSNRRRIVWDEHQGSSPKATTVEAG